MRAIDFPESNIQFNKPTSMDDSECLPISAYLGVDANGNKYINTVWQPNKEDLDAINAGRPIVVCILGGSLPPMALFTCDESGNSNDGNVETNRNVIKREWLRKKFPTYYDENCFPMNKWSFNKPKRMIYSLEYRACRTWKHNRYTHYKKRSPVRPVFCL